MAKKLNRDRTTRRAEPGDPWPAGSSTPDHGAPPAESPDATAPHDGEPPAGFVPLPPPA